MSRKILVIFGASIVLVTMAILYLLKEDNAADKVKNAYNSADWEESYQIDDQRPRGLSIFKELLEFRTKKTSVVINKKIKKEDLKHQKTSYFFVGKSFQLKTEEFDSLMSQVRNGANLFIAYDAISENIYEQFFRPSKFVWDFNEQEYILYDKNLKPVKLCTVNELDTVAITWNFFAWDSLRFDQKYDIDLVTSMSSIKDQCNFLQADLGNGHVYLHSNPHLFQNYQLLSKNGYDYAQYIVGLIPTDHKITWLELGRIAENEDSQSNQNNQGSGGQKDDSYLQFIFKHKALTLALLVALFGIILYLIFRTKRSQPFIPYLPKTANYSLSFADTIKEIYYKKESPYSILQVMRKNFIQAVNKQFFIDLSKENNEEEKKMLAEKTGVPLNQIDGLMRLFNTNVKTAVDFEYLNQTSKLQQKFYWDTGIIKEKQYNRLQSKTKRINRKMWLPLVLIFVGIFSILFGFYLLFIAAGIGIILWPIGIILLSLGIRMLLLPILKIQEDKITFYALFGRKKKYQNQQILSVELINGMTRFTMDDHSIHQITHADIGIYDLKSYEQFLSPLLKDQL